MGHSGAQLGARGVNGADFSQESIYNSPPVLSFLCSWSSLHMLCFEKSMQQVPFNMPFSWKDETLLVP